MNHLSNICLGMFLVSVNGLGFAQSSGALASESLEFEEKYAVDDSLLDRMRGGFITPDGIKIDIGIVKEIYVDGMRQLQNSFAANNIHYNGHTVSASDLQSITSDVKTIIQNNLDNKSLQSFTLVDVNVKNFGSFTESMRSLQDVRASQNVQELR